VRALAMALVLLTAAAPAAMATPSSVLGVWLTAGGDGHVEIATCGASVCGFIRGDGPPPAPGQPTTDVKNPDRALRQRPLVGLRILEGFSPTATGWINGRGYDPRTGASFRSELRPQPDGTLVLKGCVGPICRTEKWRRVQ
jgi:uncharacterized protein (DUF2147 family)